MSLAEILRPIPAEPFEPADYETLAEILANDLDIV